MDDKTKRLMIMKAINMVCKKDFVIDTKGFVNTVEAVCLKNKCETTDDEVNYEITVAISNGFMQRCYNAIVSTDFTVDKSSLSPDERKVYNAVFDAQEVVQNTGWKAYNGVKKTLKGEIVDKELLSILDVLENKNLLSSGYIDAWEK